MRTAIRISGLEMMYCNHGQQKFQQEPITNKVNKVEEQVQGDRKYNIVIYGIKECITLAYL